MSYSFATPWTIAHQAPLSMVFPRQEYWSVLPFPSPRDLFNPGIEPVPPALASRLFTIEAPGKPYFIEVIYIKYIKYVYKYFYYIKEFPVMASEFKSPRDSLWPIG